MDQESGLDLRLLQLPDQVPRLLHRVVLRRPGSPGRGPTGSVASPHRQRTLHRSISGRNLMDKSGRARGLEVDKALYSVPHHLVGEQTLSNMPEPILVEPMVLDGHCYRVAWFDRPWRPPRQETTQALGICFTLDRQIVLVTLNGTEWSLPGGTIEPGETLEQTLAGEVLEEACAHVVYCRYIGCQRVEDIDAG